jgi:hypothetical protein
MLPKVFDENSAQVKTDALIKPHEELAKELFAVFDGEINPPLSNYLDRFNFALMSTLNMHFDQSTDPALADVCIGTERSLFTRTDELILRGNRAKLGEVGYLEGKLKRNRDAYDFVAMRRDLSIGLMMVIVLGSLSKTTDPFLPSEKLFKDIKIPFFTLHFKLGKNEILISEFYLQGESGQVYYQDYRVSVGENGLSFVNMGGIYSYDGYENPKSQLIFDSLEKFKQWFDENQVYEKYRVQEKKVYEKLRKAWLRDLAGDEESRVTTI